ncbi:EKC/KEOPS complex subunit TPRKB [Ixodes scapularis]|uniref:EKC/KEOPS complex subunit TPRKB n=1 Tax=Ixodes scapularis TaxID=6945 RepID=UPI001A9E0D4B|nr:EKC/KEOPS complex subunit TPRKB [Ixodes scapularis]
MEHDVLDRSGSKLASILLFADVQNSAQLTQMAVDGAISACVVRASLIVDLFQLQCAVQKALANRRNGTMKTRSILSEILYQLAPTKNISDSLKQLGAHENDTSVVVVLVDDPDDKHCAKLLESARGERAPLEKLSALSDPQALRKLFKITDKELAVGSLLDAVVTRMAVKDTI